MEFRETDFKYVMQDISKVYIGARLTYRELGDQYDTPSKIKSVIYRVVIDEVDLDTMICEHLLTLDPKSRTYMMYEQMNATFKVLTRQEKLDKKGVLKEEYITKMYSLPELMGDVSLREENSSSVIQEICIKKRKLMGLAL